MYIYLIRKQTLTLFVLPVSNCKAILGKHNVLAISRRPLTWENPALVACFLIGEHASLLGNAHDLEKSHLFVQKDRFSVKSNPFFIKSHNLYITL